MLVSRRKFLLFGAAFAAGCTTRPGGAYLSSGRGETVVNAGPAAQYLKDGVYTRYRNLGFFMVRRGTDLFAISAVCTHRHCKLEAEPDQSFYCPCHGSTFGPDGKVKKGPARRDLPVLTLATDQKGNLLVTLPAT